MARSLPSAPPTAGTICAGAGADAFVLAATGLLDGQNATAHRHLAGLLGRMVPHADLDPDVLFVDDGPVLTSAGAASGVDARLHLVRNDHGGHLANKVARRGPWNVSANP